MAPRIGNYGVLSSDCTERLTNRWLLGTMKNSSFLRTSKQQETVANKEAAAKKTSVALSFYQSVFCVHNSFIVA